MCACPACEGSADAVSALSEQMKQMRLEQQQQLRELHMEQQRQLHEIHRLKHTVTTAGDVGARLLLGATIDPAASFLPSLPAALPANFLASLPKGVDRVLHSRKPSSSSSGSGSSATPTDTEQKALGDGDLVGELSHCRSISEQPIQDSYTALLPHLVHKLASSLHFHDTHLRNYLTCPTGKIDATFSASGAVLWSDVVTLAEFKPSLASEPAYNEAVGQVVQRCQAIFDQQPQRTRVVGMVMDATNIDVLLVEKPAPFRVRHTGRLQFALTADSAGFLALCRVLVCPFEHLGFVAAIVPRSFQLSGEIRGTVTDFIPLRAESMSPRCSAVYRASCTRWKGQQFVVKFAPSALEGGRAAAHETNLLGELAHVARSDLPLPPSIPRVLASGQLPLPYHHFHHYMLLQPFGRHLFTGSDEPLAVLARVLVDVCDAMEYAFLALRLLHRDISYGNIIVVEDPKPRGVLIDWHVADRMQANPFEERITGTRLFTAHRLFFPGHLHSLHDDLESLLYVSLHVSTDGQLPWAHSPDKNMDATKHWHLTLDAPFEELLGKCADSSRPLLAQLRGIITSALSAPFPGSAASLLSSSSAASAPVVPSQSTATPSTDEQALALLRAFRAACQRHALA